ncbi:MAG: helix-turn-helix domain-containing protein [Hydrococcus sp. RU_2_2]|nr:helix-turn-helix domain-containing protein [Hydrococcus sp. RU_2_2]NJP17795.1 helix-turn-helix domain-containing protein [Hydrococcus sp. CRU_1_1]
MSPRKLTEEDKQEILNLYRQTEETTSTLADRFGVSSSTISRFLKGFLSHAEYEDLIQQKRLARTPGGKVANRDYPEDSGQADYPPGSDKADDAPRTAKGDRNEAENNLVLEVPAIPEFPEKEKELLPSLPKLRDSFPEEDKTAALQEWTISAPPTDVFFNSETLAPVSEVAAIEEIIGELKVDLKESDDEDDDEDYEDWEEDDEEEIEAVYTPSISTKAKIQVLPLSSASFPKTCYLVIDRAAELITRPLKDFADLGKIPTEEFQQKTLPVFDNHRVARRFSNRSQRVIKVPDGRMLQKTRTYLYAKGITRLLLDGQIYSLLSP